MPVLMLTAYELEADKVRGLRGGADDYLTKPFGMPSCGPGCRRCCAGAGPPPRRQEANIYATAASRSPGRPGRSGSTARPWR